MELGVLTLLQDGRSARGVSGSQSAITKAQWLASLHVGGLAAWLSHGPVGSHSRRQAPGQGCGCAGVQVAGGLRNHRGLASEAKAELLVTSCPCTSPMSHWLRQVTQPSAASGEVGASSWWFSPCQLAPGPVYSRCLPRSGLSSSLMSLSLWGQDDKGDVMPPMRRPWPNRLHRERVLRGACGFVRERWRCPSRRSVPPPVVMNTEVRCGE